MILKKFNSIIKSAKNKKIELHLKIHRQGYTNFWDIPDLVIKYD